MRNVLLLGTLAAILSATISHPDVRTIVERSVAVSDQDWAAAPRFDFTEEDRVPTGTVRYQVMMVLGSPYYYRVAENGRPLPPDQARAEQQRLEEATARRRAESVQQRAARIAKIPEGQEKGSHADEPVEPGIRFQVCAGRVHGALSCLGVEGHSESRVPAAEHGNPSIDRNGPVPCGSTRRLCSG